MFALHIVMNTSHACLRHILIHVYIFIQYYNTYVTVEGRNQTLFTLSTFEKESSKGRKLYCKASVMTKGNFD